MKRILMLLVALLAVVTSRGQSIVIGERVPELRGVVWLQNQAPTNAPMSCLVFVHTSNPRQKAQLEHLQALSRKLGSKLNIVLVTQEAAERISSLLGPYLSDRLKVALDPERRIFASFGVDFVPFCVLLGARNRVLWMGNPLELNTTVIKEAQS